LNIFRFVKFSFWFIGWIRRCCKFMWYFSLLSKNATSGHICHSGGILFCISSYFPVQHDITEILLNVVLNTINIFKMHVKQQWKRCLFIFNCVMYDSLPYLFLSMPYLSNMDTTDTHFHTHLRVSVMLIAKYPTMTGKFRTSIKAPFL
jgi:hypothetical protein